MKHLVIIFSTLCLIACERGTLLNSEADILDVVLPQEMLTGKPIITNNEVRVPSFAITETQKEQFIEQLLTLNPQFVLTEGAHIEQVDSVRDFSKPQKYTVVSQDGKWKKTYTFSFFTAIFNLNFFDFSHYESTEASNGKQYTVFYEVTNDETFYIWSSGNAGFAITAPQNAPTDSYPTFATSEGKVGSACKLVTRSTGDLGASVKMPIAAGNLFLGDFEVSKAMSQPLEATQFGILTTQDKPVKIGLYCKYKAGPTFINKDKEVLPKVDKPNIYAVLYEPKMDENQKPIKLNGANVLTDNSIICKAVLSEQQANDIKVNNINTDNYKYIEIPFVDGDVAFDPTKQAAGKYFFTIVFSSSIGGDLFEGAIESTLCVDEVQIFFDN